MKNPLPSPATAYARIAQIASRRPVHAALGWLHLHEPQMLRWQMECVAIPSPPFGEQARGRWLAERFAQLGLDDVAIDDAGNVLGWAAPDDGRSPVLLVSAHLDTVFPAGTPIAPRLDDTRIAAPGACDNAAGITALLGVSAAMLHAGVDLPCPLVFIGNTGEEGEGDLRGTRHLYGAATWRRRIAAHLVLDGPGHTMAVTGALGSRRFAVTVEGPGGHSWNDAGRPNPLVALSDLIVRMQARRRSDAEAGGTAGNGRTAWNVGSVEGGGSVNTIPDRAKARFDLRSTDAARLAHLEDDLRASIDEALDEANRGAEPPHLLRARLERLGERPAGALAEESPMLALLRAVDRHLGLRTETRTASTDANIPLSLGVEALAIGAGGEGGGTHTTAEWFDARGRDLGLRRILLLVLALAECNAEPLDSE